MKKVSKAIKVLQGLNEEEKLELEEFFKNEEETKEEPEKKVKVEEKVVKEEEKEEQKEKFVTEDKLKSMLESFLGKVALKEEVDEIKVDNKKAKPFGKDGKPITQEVDDRDSRLSKILAEING